MGQDLEFRMIFGHTPRLSNIQAKRLPLVLCLARVRYLLQIFQQIANGVQFFGKSFMDWPLNMENLSRRSFKEIKR